MKDENGFYYYASPGNTKARVYVRKSKENAIEFRLWQADHPEVWEQHQWLPYEVICDAAALYKEERNNKADPLKIYDINLARALLKEETD